MVWAQPLMLAFLALAAIPVVIHLLGRRRARVIRFSAFDFLMSAQKRFSRWETIRRWLLLSARALLLASLVFAIARPTPPTEEKAEVDLGMIGVVFDATLSMNYLQGEQTLLERAFRMASQRLTRHQGSFLAAMVAERAVPLTESLSDDVDGVLRTLWDLESGIGEATLAEGVAQIVERIPEGQSIKLVLISDFSPGAVQGLNLDEDRIAGVEWLSVREDPMAGLPNRSVEGLVVESTEDPQVRAVRATLRNHGPEPVSANLLVESGTTVLARGSAQIQPGQSVEKRFRIRFEDPGEKKIRVRFAQSDGAPWDDWLSSFAYVGDPLAVLLVNGDPRLVAREDELYYLERALRVRPVGATPIKMDIVDAERFGLQELQRYDAVVVANAVLSEADVAKLNEYVQGGGGLLLSVGPRWRSDKINETYGELLARKLRSWHLAADERAGVGPVAAELASGYVFGKLDKDLREGLGYSQTAGHFNVATGTSKEQTLIRLVSGEPLLVEKRLGSGVTMLWTSSLDRDASDMCLQPFFPALIQTLMHRLASRGAELPRLSVARSGTKFAIPVTRGTANYRLETEEGDEIPTTMTGAWVEARGETGWYSLFDEDGELATRAVVHESRSESSYAPPRELTEREGVAMAGLGSQFGGDGRHWSAWLLLLAVIWFSAEAVLSTRG